MRVSRGRRPRGIWGPRDRFIGWSPPARQRNVHLLSYNTRYLILPWVKVPRLASHLLGRVARIIARDWQQVYGYGSGFPFTRLERLESNLGIPLPASTQWEIAEELAEDLDPAFAELIRQAAQGEVLYNDDTPMRILQFVNAAG